MQRNGRKMRHTRVRERKPRINTEEHGKTRKEKKDGDRMISVENVICPKCREEMESGYIYSPREIMWANDNKKKIFGIGDETLVGINISFTHNKIPAYRCKDCNIVTFEYSQSV